METTTVPQFGSKVFVPTPRNDNQFKALGTMAEHLPRFTAIKLNKTNTGLVLYSADGSCQNLRFSKGLKTALQEGTLTLQHLPFFRVADSVTEDGTVFTNLIVPEGFGNTQRVSITDFLAQAATALPEAPKANPVSMMSLKNLG